MELLEYIKKNYKTPNVAVLRTLGATDELIKYLINTPNNTNMKVVESLISGGDGDEKQGIKSITISPAITTTPALASLLPIYYEDLTEEERREGRAIRTTTTADLGSGGEYTFTITPTADWYMADMTGGTPTFGGKGEPITVKRTATEYGGLYFEVVACETNQPDEASKIAPIRFVIEQTE